MAVAAGLYMPSMAARWRSSTTLRFTFRLGVSSPEASVKSLGRMVNALMVS